jgi:hypothetical protein
MSISLAVHHDSSPLQLLPDIVAIAGFTGRDQEAVAEHLVELRELGVPTPSSTPCFYQSAPESLVQTDTITVVGSNTSGEAECVVIEHRGERFLTLGSDHTDRAAEAIDIPLSKLACPKPIAGTAWRIDDITDHIGEIELRSWIDDGDGEVLYQEGVVRDFMPLDEIITTTPFRRQPESFALFCGTLAAIGGIRPSPTFRAELRDPITGNVIELAYRTVVADYLDL